jgi:uncharacterized protein (TIGR03437 family)
MRLCFATIIFCLSASGAEYTFQTVAERGQNGISEFGPYIVMNASGRVAFRAKLVDAQGQEAGEAIFSGAGGELTKVADSSGPFSLMEVNSINSSGTVLFQAVTDDFNLGLFTGSGGATSPVILSSVQERLPSYPSLYGDLADNGDVVYRGIGKIMFLSRGVLRTVANSNATGRFEGVVLSNPRLNGRGGIGFSGYDISEPRVRGGVFIDNNGVLTTLAEESGPLNTFLGLPGINDEGKMISYALADGFPIRDGAYLFSNGRTETAYTGEPDRIGLVDLNNSGKFLLGLRTSGSSPGGLFSGPDLTKDKVIALGDLLFGSRMVAFAAGSTGGRILNDKGQVAFAYRLDNGRVGIAVATPAGGNPGPSTGGAPFLPRDSIVNAASLAPSSIPSPGSIVSLFGSNFASTLRVAESAVLPTSLDGVSVTFNGVPAPLYFVAPGQINAQVPFEISGSNAEVRVRNAQGESEVRSLVLSVVSPALYTLNQSGGGQAIAVFANSATLAAPRGATSDSRPARAGDVLTLYANGLGAVTPSIASGVNSCGGACRTDGANLQIRRVVTAPAISIGGTRIPDQNVLFAGLAPEFVGLYQINVLLPSGLPVGSAVPIVLGQGSVASRADVTIAIE